MCSHSKGIGWLYGDLAGHINSTRVNSTCPWTLCDTTIIPSHRIIRGIKRHFVVMDHSPVRASSFLEFSDSHILAISSAVDTSGVCC